MEDWPYKVDAIIIDNKKPYTPERPPPEDFLVDIKWIWVVPEECKPKEIYCFSRYRTMEDWLGDIPRKWLKVKSKHKKIMDAIVNMIQDEDVKDWFVKAMDKWQSRSTQTELGKQTSMPSSSWIFEPTPIPASNLRTPTNSAYIDTGFRMPDLKLMTRPDPPRPPKNWWHAISSAIVGNGSILRLHSSTNFGPVELFLVGPCTHNNLNFGGPLDFDNKSESIEDEEIPV